MSSQSLSWQLRVQGRYQSWTGHHSIARHAHTHTHTHPDWGNFNTPINLMCTSLGYGRKQEHQKKTHAGKLHTNSGPRQELIFSYPCYNRMTLNEMIMLFKDLLYNRITNRISQSLTNIQSSFETYFTSNAVMAIRKAWKNVRRETQK